MQKLNILIAGKGYSLPFIAKSELLGKLYITSEYENIEKIEFNTFRELAQKCKNANIDFVITEDEKFMKEGISDVLNSLRVNCIAPPSGITNLTNLDLKTREELSKFNIKTPEIFSFPKNFPLTLKLKNIEKPAFSISEMIEIKNELTEEYPSLINEMIIQEYDGENIFTLYSLYDGETLYNFNIQDFNREIRKIAEEFSENLQNFLGNQKARFVGFINSKLALWNDILYLKGFDFNFPSCNFEKDLLFTLITAEYRKLNEL